MCLADRVQLDAVIGELLAQPGDILGVAGKAVERLADDDVDLAALDRAQQLLETRPVVTVARQLRIEPGVHHLAAQVRDQRPARGDLVGARRTRLQRRRMATIRGDAGRGRVSMMF